jgi:hypothetical protein
MALALAGLGFVCPAASSAPATEAIQSLVGLTDFGVIAHDGAGFAFKPATNLYVSALGYLFATNYAALDSAVVELLDSRGLVRASATLTTNPPPTGGWSYQDIPAVFLPANSTNYIVAYDPVEYAANHVKVWAGAYVEAISPDTAWFEPASELLYLGPAQGTNVIGEPWYYLIGANLQFTVAPAPPALHIGRTLTNTVVLTWPTQAAAFSLQAATNLLSWPTTNLPVSPVVSGTNNLLVLPATERQTCFRLVQ